MKGRINNNTRSPVATAQQRKLAQLLVEGERTLIECYIDAYNQTEEKCKNRARLSARAHSASKTAGVQHYIRLFQEQQAIEEARLLVWDRRKASKRLLQMTREIEVNIEITRKLRDKMLDDGELKTTQQLSQMLKVAQICNDTSRAIREVLHEMNEMYGLTKPEVSLTNAIQVIIGGAEQLPEDTID